MISPVDQRWSGRRSVFVPPTERFNPLGYEVAVIPDDLTARRFVEREHYSGSYVAALRRFGLYAPGGHLVGVAVFSVPTNDLALRPLPGDPRASMELGRFVLVDSVRFNGESFFLSRCLDALRTEGVVGVVSFSDPEPRTSVAGELVFRGHVGQIYQARSAAYLGRATPRTLRLLPDGGVFSDRAAQKIRARERGWVAAADQLVRHGAPTPTPTPGGDLGPWLVAALAAVTRKRRHGGCHKYIFPLCRAARRALPARRPPYPRFSPELLTRCAPCCA